MRWLRPAGAVVAAAGLFVAFAWPQIAERHSGSAKARLVIFDRDDGGWEHGWRPGQVDLAPADNPVRVVVEARFAPTAVRRRVNTGLVMIVARAGVVIRESTLDMPVPAGEHVVDFSTPEFTVARAGRYTIAIRSTETEDAGFLGADAVVRTGAAGDPNRWRMPAYAAIAIGAVAYILGGGRCMTRSRRRRRRRRR